MATRASEQRQKPSRRYDPAETRARVVEAAYNLFSTRGYSNTGTADIAREADVSEGSIFYHFGSKRALLTELGRLHGEKMVAAMQGDDRLEELEPGMTIRRCFAFMAANQTWEQFAHSGSDCPSAPHGKHEHNAEAAPFFDAARETVQAWVENQFRVSFAHRGITGIDPVIAASLTFTVVGDALDMASHPGITPEHAAYIVDQCIRFVRGACGYPVIRD